MGGLAAVLGDALAVQIELAQSVARVGVAEIGGALEVVGGFLEIGEGAVVLEGDLAQEIIAAALFFAAAFSR